MRTECEECGEGFAVTTAEQELLAKIFDLREGLPPISKCPLCRMRQRLCFRNERKLYKRRCDSSGRQIVSIYRPDAPFTVFDQSVWWSDAYDPLEFGREYDFSRPFFEQLAELHRAVPKLSIHNAKSENCEYTNYSSENRNCYLVVGGLGAEDCLYSYRVFYSKNVVDSFGISRSELCYEALQGSELYRCAYVSNCHSSSDLVLCEDCVGCRECFGSINLRNARHCVFNEQLSEQEYHETVAQLMLDMSGARARYRQLRASIPLRAAYAINCEESRGDQIRNCQRCSDTFFLFDSEDVLHARNGENNRDCADLNFGDNCELQYQAANLEKNYRVAFASLAWYVSESCYILSCFNSSNLFGCCGMKKHAYCILNRQYSQKEYFALRGRIIEHMQSTGEWGLYFPPSMSPFLFAETVAAELAPLTEAECVARGYLAGAPPLPAERGQLSEQNPPCAHCGRAFRYIPQERLFYEKMGLSEPECCPDCRHEARMNMRRPMALRRSVCAGCATAVETSVREGAVLCESCYAKSTV